MAIVSPIAVMSTPHQSVINSHITGIGCRWNFTV